MENNPELQLAWQFIENTGTHLFLTGKAGTGKTTFLRRLKEHTPKRMVVLPLSCRKLPLILPKRITVTVKKSGT